MPVVKCISSAKYFLEYAFMFPVIVSVEGILPGWGRGICTFTTTLKEAGIQSVCYVIVSIMLIVVCDQIANDFDKARY